MIGQLLGAQRFVNTARWCRGAAAHRSPARRGDTRPPQAPPAARPIQAVTSSTETLRNWVLQAEVDAGQRPGASSVESEELKRLRRENVELRRANEILKAHRLSSQGSSTLDFHACSVYHGLQGAVRGRADLFRANRVRNQDRPVHLLCRPLAAEIGARGFR